MEYLYAFKINIYYSYTHIIAISPPSSRVIQLISCNSSETKYNCDHVPAIVSPPPHAALLSSLQLTHRSRLLGRRNLIRTLHGLESSSIRPQKIIGQFHQHSTILPRHLGLQKNSSASPHPTSKLSSPTTTNLNHREQTTREPPQKPP
jgi:hypothetical protein